jgi:hypothetical protein
VTGPAACLQGHFQNAYVTPDMDQAVAMLRRDYGVEKVRVIEAKTQMWTPTGEGEAAMRVGITWVGGLQYELIEPVSGLVDLYREAVVPDQPLRLHHIAMRADDLDAVRAESDRCNRPVACSGQSGSVRYMYVDARATLGHYLEYVSAPPEFWESFTRR